MIEENSCSFWFGGREESAILYCRFSPERLSKNPFFFWKKTPKQNKKREGKFYHGKKKPLKNLFVCFPPKNTPISCIVKIIIWLSKSRYGKYLNAGIPVVDDWHLLYSPYSILVIRANVSCIEITILFISCSKY